MKKIDESILSEVITKRPEMSYKGNFGKVLIIAGSTQFGGAALMSTAAAVNSGAGLVTVATVPEKFLAVNVKIPEAMTIDYDDHEALIQSIKKSNVIVIGPGLPLSSKTTDLINLTLKNTNELHTLIIDASALTIIAKEKINLKDLHVNLILTPHQGEWERLSGLEINQQIPENNLTALNNLAPQSILIVKKHLSDIYYQGKVSQLSNGNPGMATGGMGDTLTGIIAGFVAQFGFSLKAVSAALYLHSYIGDNIYKKHYVVIPSELINKISKTMQKFTDTEE